MVSFSSSTSLQLEIMSLIILFFFCQVEKFSAPSDATKSAVNTWLASHGVSAENITPAGDWLSVRVPVSKAEELLNTKYDVYTHTASGKQSIRTLEYSLPPAVAGVVKAIHPTTSYVFRLFHNLSSIVGSL